MLLLTVIVVVHAASLYLHNAGTTTSYDIAMDDGVDSTGITLTTGIDFKLAVGFVDTTTLQGIDPSAYLSTVGVSLLKETYTRINGAIIPYITSIDLLPCQKGYIESWIAPNVDQTYFTNLQYAYCVPDNISL
jgi:DUF1680 family protein